MPIADMIKENSNPGQMQSQHTSILFIFGENYDLNAEPSQEVLQTSIPKHLEVPVACQAVVESLCRQLAMALRLQKYCANVVYGGMGIAGIFAAIASGMKFEDGLKIICHLHDSVAAGSMTILKVEEHSDLVAKQVALMSDVYVYSQSPHLLLFDNVHQVSTKASSFQVLPNWLLPIRDATLLGWLQGNLSSADLHSFASSLLRAKGHREVGPAYWSSHLRAPKDLRALLHNAATSNVFVMDKLLENDIRSLQMDLNIFNSVESLPESLKPNTSAGALKGIPMSTSLDSYDGIAANGLGGTEGARILPTSQQDKNLAQRYRTHWVDCTDVSNSPRAEDHCVGLSQLLHIYGTLSDFDTSLLTKMEGTGVSVTSLSVANIQRSSSLEALLDLDATEGLMLFYTAAVEEQSVEKTCRLPIDILKCLAKQRTKSKRVVCFWITTDASAYGNPNTAQSALFGLIKTMRRELSRHSTHVAIDGLDVDLLWQDVGLTLSGEKNWSAVRYQDRKRLCPRIEVAKQTVTTPPSFQSMCFLVTGGIGDVTIELNQWLVKRGVSKLILTGRRSVKDPDVQSRLRQMSLAIPVEYVQADVSNESEMLKLLHQANFDIHGIIHAAGMTGDCPVARLTWEHVETVIRPKVNGGIVLDHLSRKYLPNLKHFILLSSITGTIGNATQSSYTIGNYFLDALAVKRRHDGFAALSLQLGAFKSSKMAAPLLNPVAGISIFLPMDSEHAINTIEAVLDQGPVEAISDLDMGGLANAANCKTDFLFSSLLDGT